VSLPERWLESRTLAGSADAVLAEVLDAELSVSGG
jgi:hypothetical protein